MDRRSAQPAAPVEPGRAPGVARTPIIFFDGECRMCNRFVDMVLRADARGIFRFAPLQGETAKSLLPPLGDDPRRWSMLYLDGHGVHEQSDASLEVYRRLGGAWALLGLARWIPRPLRNPVYRLIAANRYRWFGTRACRVPAPAEMERFLP
jgi:predicted DCC family thiol-disulfide oxidoreductase YuxK